MTLARLWAFLAVGLPVLAAFISNLSSVDLAYHLRAGEIILDAGRIPTVDTFTFTASGTSWLNQQWGAQLVLAAVYRLAGWTGLVIFRAALVGVIFGCLFEACRRLGLDLRRASWLTIAAFIVSAVALALRPQLLGMALLAVTLLLVADRRDEPHHRVAADDAPDRSGNAVLRLGGTRDRPPRQARSGDAVADARLARRLRGHRGLRDPRRRLVAAGGRDRGCRTAFDLGPAGR
jgi:hypothetical protein